MWSWIKRAIDVLPEELASGLKSYRKYAVNFRPSISSLVSPLASLFLELNIMESKFSGFTSAFRQLIASKENVNIEGECSSIDDI